MADSAPPAPTDPAVAPPPTVLLVDDEPSVLSALRRLFRTQGYRIEQATGGADALALMRDTPVDLVVSDMRMPDMAARVIDRAMQVHGAAGVSQDTFLAEAYAYARYMRMGDGPDQVHLAALGRALLKRHG